jgi:hypothetical protein
MATLSYSGIFGDNSGGADPRVSPRAAHDPQRRDCVAGHVRLELRNVVANYLFEKPHRFPGI